MLRVVRWIFFAVLADAGIGLHPPAVNCPASVKAVQLQPFLTKSSGFKPSTEKLHCERWISANPDFRLVHLQPLRLQCWYSFTSISQVALCSDANPDLPGVHLGDMCIRCPGPTRVELASR